MNRYRILVVEDDPQHQQSARDTLSGHDVTVVGSFDKAMALMTTRYEDVQRDQILREAGYPEEPRHEDDHLRRKAYLHLLGLILRGVPISFPYEVVLTDMKLPMSRQMLHPDAYIEGEQVDYGYVIALRAALCGAKFVAMLTDTNHHKGAMSAALDYLATPNYSSGLPPNFTINGATCMFVHAPFVEKRENHAPCQACNATGKCRLCGGTGTRKDERTQETSCHYCQGGGTCTACKGVGKRDYVIRTRLKDWGQVLADLITFA